MCKRPDCPNPERAKHLRHIGEVKDNPLYSPGIDDMPDGFHAKPMRLWAAKPQKVRLAATVDEEQVIELRQQRRSEYEELPDPKPNYFDWLALVDEEDRFWDAYWLRKTAMYAGDRLKAIAQINESSKAKPKQTLEVLAKEEGVDLDGLLAKILRAKGLSEVQAFDLIDKLPTIQ